MRLNVIVNLALLVGAVVIVGLVLRREFGLRASPVTPSVQMQRIGSESWEELLSGGHLLYGSQDAPVKVVEFADFQCGACAIASEEIRALHDRNPDLVAVVYRHYPLQALHEHAYAAAVASECAAEQDMYRAYHDVLFKRQGELGETPWSTLAEVAKVPDTVAFRSCLDSSRPHYAVAGDTVLAYHLGVRRTPTFLVNGNMLLTRLVAEQWDRLVSRLATTDTTAVPGTHSLR